MAAPGKKSAGSAEEWLLNGSDRDESGDPRTNRAETEQWLVEPATEQNGEKSTAAAAPPPPSPPSPAPPAPPAPSAPSAPPVEDERAAPKPTPADEKMLQDLQAENRDLLQRVRELHVEMATQAERAQAERAQAEEAKTFDQREVELRDRIDELEAALADANGRAQAPAAAGEGNEATTQRSSKKKGLPDLNEASFEQLRNLGLSVTQSARVIAYRDVRGGYQSLDELDEIPGLPKETRMELREKLSLST